MDRKRSIFIVNFLGKAWEGGFSRFSGTPSKYCDCGHLHFHVFPPTFPCFFQDAIEEIYNKDASLSIHLKKFIYFCAWLAMP